MRSKLLPYKIGLGVLGLFTLVMLIVVIVGAGNYKHDNDLYQQASNAANKLNDYVNNNQTVPDNLGQAGVTNVSSDITYTKLNSSSYRFCVDYKAGYSGFSSAQVEQQILSSAYGGSGNGSGGYGDNTALYLNPYFHKGENCQTVNPSIFQFNPGGPIQPVTDPYAKCNSISDNTAYYNCINQIQNQQTNNQLQSPSSSTTTL